jgi:hypothetical protein
MSVTENGMFKTVSVHVGYSNVGKMHDNRLVVQRTSLDMSRTFVGKFCELQLIFH